MTGIGDGKGDIGYGGFRRGIYCGGISGLVTGVFANIFGCLLILAGVMGVTEPIEFAELSFLWAAATIPFFIAYGIVLGMLYQVVRPLMPGAGLRKGIYYALMVWVWSDVVAKAGILGTWKAAIGSPELLFVVNLLVISFPAKILFGSVLERLWQREG